MPSGKENWAALLNPNKKINLLTAVVDASVGTNKENF